MVAFNMEKIEGSFKAFTQNRPSMIENILERVFQAAHHLAVLGFPAFTYLHPKT
jgi:hypothetical protein